MASHLRLSRREFWGGQTSRIYDAVAGERLAGWAHARFPPEGSRILDVGCGPGNWALRAARALPGSLVAGVDFSLPMVQRAEAKRRREGVLNCRFIAADARALPFLAESFDRARSTASLKFWPEPIQGLDEIHRILAPGGKLLVIEAARDTPPEEIREFLRSIRVGPLARSAGGWILSRFLRHHGLRLDSVAEIAARSRFRGGKAALLPGSPFFSLELSRSDDLPRARELAPGPLRRG